MLFPTPILLKSDQELSFPEHLSAIGEFTGKKILTHLLSTLLYCIICACMKLRSSKPHSQFLLMPVFLL